MSKWIVATSAFVRLARAAERASLAKRARCRALSTSAAARGGPRLRTRESTEEGIVVLSPHTEVVCEKRTLTEHVWENMGEWEDKKAVTCSTTGVSYTYKELRELCRRFCCSLLAPIADGGVGMRRKDVIAILMPNSTDYPVVFHGAIEAGLTVSTANPSFTPGEVSRQLNSSKANVLVATFESLATAKEAIKDVPTCDRIIVIDNETHKADLRGCISYTALLSRSPNTEVCCPEIPMDLDSTVLLPFSSGTEGLPKGVMLSHKNLVSSICMVEHPDIIFPLSDDPNHQDKCLAVLPFYHIFGMNGLMNFSLRMGREIIVVPKFESTSFVKTIRKFKPSVVYLVPPLLLFLAKHPEVKEEDLSSIKQIICGAAPATKTIIESFLERAGRSDIDFREGYGLTETSGIASIMPKWAGMSKTGSCGCIAPMTEARIVDETGKGVGAFSKGELFIKGPQVMKGYLNNEKATKKTLDADGWLHTGDVAYFDEEGYLYIVDRVKELIKVKGSQVSPTEIEEIVHQCPGVADVAVVGIPDLRAGELPAAFVVRKNDDQGSQLKAEDINSWMSTRAAQFKQLAGGIRFIDFIPKSASGKVLRRELIQIVEKEKAGA